jgi:hypothetical protein
MCELFVWQLTQGDICHYNRENAIEGLFLAVPLWKT